MSNHFWNISYIVCQSIFLISIFSCLVSQTTDGGWSRNSKTLSLALGIVLVLLIWPMTWVKIYWPLIGPFCKKPTRTLAWTNQRTASWVKIWKNLSHQSKYKVRLLFPPYIKENSTVAWCVQKENNKNQIDEFQIPTDPIIL